MSNSSANCLLFNDSSLCEDVIIVKRVTASISLLGCALMLFIIFLYKKTSTFVQRIILYMTLSTLLSAVAYVMGDTQGDGPFCQFQGYLTSVSDWSVLMWMFIITLTLHFAIVRNKEVGSKEWLYHLLGWGFPVAISFLPFIDSHFGPAGAWCWVDDPYWRFGFWFIPLFIMLIVLISLFAHIVYVVHQRVKNSHTVYNPDAQQSQRMMLEEIKQLRAYPFIYLILNIFPLVNRIQNAVSKNEALFWLTLLHVISISLLGAVNAVVFGLNKQTIEDIKWRNFKKQLYNRFSSKKTLIGEYQPQEDEPAINDE